MVSRSLGNQRISIAVKILLPLRPPALRIPRQPLYLTGISLLLALLTHTGIALLRNPAAGPAAGALPAPMPLAAATQRKTPADWRALDALLPSPVVPPPTVSTQPVASTVPAMPELQLIAALSRSGAPMVCLFEPIVGRTFLLRPGETDGDTGVSLVFSREQQLALLHAASGELLPLTVGTQLRSMPINFPAQQP